MAGIRKETDKAKRPFSSLLSLPNLLTAIRLILIPFLALCLHYDTEQLALAKDWTFRYTPGKMATLIIIVAGITDLLDGYYARKYRMESLIGRFLDPLADKLLLLVGLIMLLKLDRIDEWLVIALLSREMFITGLRAIAIGEGLVISARDLGKWKLVFQLVGLGFLTWYGTVFGIPAYQVGLVIMYIALFISLFSGYKYVVEFISELKKKEKKLLEEAGQG